MGNRSNGEHVCYSRDCSVKAEIPHIVGYLPVIPALMMAMKEDQLYINFDGPAGLTETERNVLSLIQRGRENAISMPTLASAVMISTRELQSIIQHLINDCGVMIASATGKNHGYYVPETAEEYRAAVDQLKHRIISLAKRIRAIDKTAYEEIFGQGNIFQEVKEK